jgi:hypothetical protein
VLLDRHAERGALDRLLADVHAGRSRALVLRGDPGVAKTELLHYLVDRAAEFRVMRVTGVQSEMELAFAGLHQLWARVPDSVDRLPPPQRDSGLPSESRSEAPRIRISWDWQYLVSWPS